MDGRGSGGRRSRSIASSPYVSLRFGQPLPRIECLMALVFRIPILSIATNGPSLVHKVRFVASTLLDSIREADTAPKPAARALNYLCTSNAEQSCTEFFILTGDLLLQGTSSLSYPRLNGTIRMSHCLRILFSLGLSSMLSSRFPQTG